MEIIPKKRGGGNGNGMDVEDKKIIPRKKGNVTNVEGGPERTAPEQSVVVSRIYQIFEEATQLGPQQLPQKMPQIKLLLDAAIKQLMLQAPQGGLSDEKERLLLTGAEKTNLENRILTLTNSNKAKEELTKTLEKSLKDLKNKLAIKEKGEEKLLNKMDAESPEEALAKQLLREAQELQKQAEMERDKVQAEYQKVYKEASEMQARLEKDKKDIAAQKDLERNKLVADYNTRVASLNKAVEEAKSQLSIKASEQRLIKEAGEKQHKELFDKYQKTINEETSKSKQLLLESKEAIQKRLESEALVKKLETERDSKEKIAQGLQKRVEELKGEVLAAKSNTNKDIMEQMKSQGEKIAKLESEKSQLDLQVTRLLKEALEAKKQLNKATTEREQSTTTAQSLLEQKEKLTLQASTLEKQLQELKESNRETVSKLDRVNLDLAKKNSDYTLLEAANKQLREEKAALDSSFRQVQVEKKESDVQLSLAKEDVLRKQELLDARMESDEKLVEMFRFDLLKQELDRTTQRAEFLQKELDESQGRERDLLSRPLPVCSSDTGDDALNGILTNELDELKGIIRSVDAFQLEEASLVFIGPYPYTPSPEQKILLFPESTENVLLSLIQEHRKLEKLMYVDKDGDLEYFLKTVDKDTAWDGFRVVRENDLSAWRVNYGVPDPDYELKLDGRLGAHVPVTTLSHLDAVNQVTWQARVSEMRDIPGEFNVQMWFSRGMPKYAIQKELRFVATNVHMIKDPNNASGDLYYAIDLAKPESLSHLQYIQLGSLIRNAIYGHGSLAYRVINTESGEEVKSDTFEDYKFPTDASREYMTEVMLSPSDDVIFYARDLKGDTYLLETILIKA